MTTYISTRNKGNNIYRKEEKKTGRKRDEKGNLERKNHADMMQTRKGKRTEY